MLICYNFGIYIEFGVGHLKFYEKNLVGCKKKNKIMVCSRNIHPFRFKGVL
jgi:hypothetical protein